MPLTVGDREIRPLTADEVMRMVEAGILEDGERIELLHGALTRMSGQSPGHVEVVSNLLRWLMPREAEGGFHVRAQHPLVVADETSLPEPDIAVVEPGRTGGGTPTPPSSSSRSPSARCARTPRSNPPSTPRRASPSCG